MLSDANNITCLFCRLSHLAFLFSALLRGRAFPFWFKWRGVKRLSLQKTAKRFYQTDPSLLSQWRSNAGAACPPRELTARAGPDHPGQSACPAPGFRARGRIRSPCVCLPSAALTLRTCGPHPAAAGWGWSGQGCTWFCNIPQKFHTRGKEIYSAGWGQCTHQQHKTGEVDQNFDT